MAKKKSVAINAQKKIGAAEYINVFITEQRLNKVLDRVKDFPEFNGALYFSKEFSREIHLEIKGDVAGAEYSWSIMGPIVKEKAKEWYLKLEASN